jgi:hypothetical protein
MLMGSGEKAEVTEERVGCAVVEVMGVSKPGEDDWCFEVGKAVAAEGDAPVEPDYHSEGEIDEGVYTSHGLWA